MDVVRASAVGRACEASPAEVRPWVAMALFLLRERADPHSRWRPYLDLLPPTLDSPLFWTEEELKELQGTQVLGSVESYRERVHEEHATTVATVLAEGGPGGGLFLGDDGRPPLADFEWAFGIVRSRTFPPFTGDNLALVPLADLVNHGCGGVAPEKAVWERRGAGVFDRQKLISMRAWRTYQAGEQVFMDYGREKSNGELALEYGFVDSGGKAAPPPPRAGGPAGAAGGGSSRDRFSLSLSVAEGDPFFDDKADIAEISGYDADSTFFELSVGQAPPDALLAYLRLVALGGADAFLLEALFRNAVWGHLSSPVSRENEEAVCQAMVDGCRGVLAGYPSTIEQDLRLLDARQLSRRHEVAVRVRLGEQKALTETLEWFEARLRGLDELEYYAERRLRDIGLLDDKGNMTPWVFNA